MSETLELGIFVDPDPRVEFSDAFSIHPTDELPMKVSKVNVFEFDGGKSLEVEITPGVVRSDESLKSLGPTDRSCYFEGERNLRFFKVYTPRNCEIECFSNFSQILCNCVPFDIVRDHDTKVCGVTKLDLNCIENLRKNFTDYRPTGMLATCSCLSKCDSVSYNIEIIESELKEIE